MTHGRRTISKIGLKLLAVNYFYAFMLNANFLQLCWESKCCVTLCCVLLCWVSLCQMLLCWVLLLLFIHSLIYFEHEHTKAIIGASSLSSWSLFLLRKYFSFTIKRCFLEVIEVVAVCLHAICIFFLWKLFYCHQ